MAKVELLSSLTIKISGCQLEQELDEKFMSEILAIANTLKARPK